MESLSSLLELSLNKVHGIFIDACISNDTEKSKEIKNKAVNTVVDEKKKEA